MNKTITKLKENNQDFEWYPTTNLMLKSIKKHMLKNYIDYFSESKKEISTKIKILDCGAGDGRVLNYLAQKSQKYAIEKSKILIEKMGKSIFVTGTDFFQSTLIDKKMDVIFSNPPYSEYEKWATKIILEANCTSLYLILPHRWKKSINIQNALETRDVEASILGTFDFLDAERQARAKVNIIHIYITKDRYENNDPFDTWFDANFKIKNKKKKPDYTTREQDKKAFKETINKALTKGKGVVQVLVELYNNEMEHLQKMFLSVCDLDPAILSELNINKEGLKESLKLKIEGLKNKYWRELFTNYKKISSRLTHKSRKKLFDKLTSEISIDFNLSNVYAVTIWVIKNANDYYNSQLIDTLEKLITKANVKLYKSNKRVYTDKEWRYTWKPEDLQKYSLELRLVLNRVGGLNTDSFYGVNNLNKTAIEFLDDLLVIINNLGFSSIETAQNITKEWKSNKTETFHTKDTILMEVKAFKNGNLHIKFNQEIIRKLNVEFGRLKGWLHNPIQASEELNIPIKQTEKLFKSNYQLTNNSGLLQIGFKEKD